MAELEIVHVKNGEGNNPLYKIRKVGGDWVSSALLKEHQALEYLEKHVPKEVAVAVVEETTTVPDYKNMTKVQLEELMRGHGIELDRRKSKKALLTEVKNFFN
jgi:hypothetical protein